MPQQNSVFSHVSKDIELKKFNQAMMKLSSLSLKYSKDVQFLTYLAQTQKALNDTNGLIKTLTEMIKFNSHPSWKIELMQQLYIDGRINQALDIGLELQGMQLPESDTKKVSNLLIKIYIEENDFEGVSEVIGSFNLVDQSDDFICWSMGLVNLSRGDKNLALECFRKAVNINNGNDRAWVSLALLHHEMGDNELALANLEKSLDLNPLNSSAVKLYSSWTQKNGDKIGSAIGRIRFYLSEYEFDEEISLCHVQMLCQTRSWQEANFEIDKLIFTHPQNAAYFNLKKNLGVNLKL